MAVQPVPQLCVQYSFQATAEHDSEGPPVLGFCPRS